MNARSVRCHNSPARDAQQKPLRPELLLKFKPDSRTTVSRDAVRALAQDEGVSETQLIHLALAQFRDRAARRAGVKGADMRPVATPTVVTESSAVAPAPASGTKHSTSALATKRRPRSLREVALWGRERGHVDSFLREFLDEFYVAADAGERSTMLSDEPPLSADERANAYFAAVAEHLALRYHLPVPSWAGKSERFLRRPFFPGGLESLKARLLVESPTAFRRRMIFVDADPLYRPRRDTASAAIGR